MANALTAGLSGAGQGASLGTSIMPGWGTAIGAVGGALAGALPALLGDENEKANGERLRKLRKLQELDALGFNPAEREQYYNQIMASVEPQMEKMTNDRNRQLASSIGMGAGQGMESVAQQEEQLAHLRTEAAMKLEAAHLERKRQMEDELSGRIAVQGQRTKDRQAAVGGILKTGMDAFTEQDVQSKTVTGKGNSAAVSSFAKSAGISEGVASKLLSALGDNPDLLEGMKLLGGK